MDLYNIYNGAIMHCILFKLRNLIQIIKKYLIIRNSQVEYPNDDHRYKALGHLFDDHRFVISYNNI